MNDLTGRTVLVTGASSGIGAAIAAAVGAAGANVIAHYRTRRAGAERATRDVPASRKLLVDADLATAGGADRLWDAAVGWRGSLDVLVNNAAVLDEAPLTCADDTWDAVWERALQVNVRAPADLMRHAVRSFTADGGGGGAGGDGGGGVLITIGSWVAHRGSANPGLTSYSASKAAVMAATKTLARVYAADGVLGYCVSPGTVDTDMTWNTVDSIGGRDAVLASLAMGEPVPPSEIADVVVFLATGRCRHLSGATIDVNGATYLR